MGSLPLVPPGKPNYIRAYLKDMYVYATLRQDRQESISDCSSPVSTYPIWREKKNLQKKGSNIGKRRKRVFAESLRTQAMLRMISVLGSFFQHFSGPGIPCVKAYPEKSFPVL